MPAEPDRGHPDTSAECCRWIEPALMGRLECPDDRICCLEPSLALVGEGRPEDGPVGGVLTVSGPCYVDKSLIPGREVSER